MPHFKHIGLLLTALFLTSRSVSAASKANEPCKLDTDCNAPYEVCTIGDGEDGSGFCNHKALFPMLASEFFGLFVVTALLIFTNIGGLGGGGILIPVMLGGLYQFDTRNAVSLSNASIAVATLTRYFVNLHVKHPLKNGTGTQTDYNITILMLPGIIIGASLGSIVNLSLPGPIIIAGFLLCNCYAAFIGCRNFMRIRRKEKDMVSP